MPDCPDDETLAAVLGGDAPLTASLSAHLDRCRPCRELLATLIEDEGPATTDDGLDHCYPLVTEVSRSGHARVSIVRDPIIGREVALKELVVGDRDALARARAEARFEREARITAQLAHPSIAPVHEIGHDADGTPYYTMGRVRGDTLADVFRRCGSLGERLRLLGHFADLCHAVAYAHSRGVIHRDIKPRNVMIGEFGETVLLDWGLARIHGIAEPTITPLDVDPGREHGEATVEGDVLGTPSYMSPEQASGAPVDERTDVWGLGAVLYELLTGRPPFEGATTTAVLRAVIHDRPTAIEALALDAPAALIAIANRALEPDLKRRYRSASELAADIEAFRDGRRVAAHEYGLGELLRAFVAAHRAAVAIGALAVVIGAIGAVLYQRSLVASRERARAAEEAADAGRRTAIAERAASEASLGLALTQQAGAARGRGDSGAAHLLAASALLHHETPRARGVLVAQGSDALPELLWRDRPGLSCNSLAYSPDAPWLACASDRHVVVWDASTGRERWRFGATNVRALSFTPGHRVAAAGEGMIRLWDITSGAAVMIPGVATSAVAFSPDGALLASSDKDGQILIRRTDDGMAVRRLAAHRGVATAIAYSPDGAWLATAGRDGELRIWNAATGALHRVYDATKLHPILALGFAPDGNTLVTAGQAGEVAVWRSDPRPVLWLRGHDRDVRAVRFSSDGRRILTAGDDGTVRSWDATDGGDATIVARCNGPIASLAIQAGDAALVIGSQGAVRMVDAHGRRELARVDGHSAPVWSLATTANGEVVSVDADGGLRVRELDQGAIVAAAELGLEANRVAVSPTGQIVISTGDGLWMWDRGSRTASKLVDRSSRVHGVAFVDAESIAAVGEDGRIAVYDARSGRELASFATARPLYTLAVTADGSLAAAGAEGAIHLWNPRTGATRRLTGKPEAVTKVAVFPDGRSLVSACRDGSVELWRLDGAAPPQRLAGIDGVVMAVAVDPLGQRIAAAGADRAIHVWDSAGQLIAAWPAHRDVVGDLAFASDGTLLSAGSYDYTIARWNLQGLRSEHVIAIGSPVTGIAWLRDANAIALGTRSGELRLMRLDDGTTLASRMTGAPVNALATSATVVASGHRDGMVQLSTVSNLAEIRTPRRTGKAINAVAFDRTGAQLAWGGDGSSAIGFERSADAVTAAPTDPSVDIMTLAFSPDGTTLGVGATDGVLRLLSPMTNERARTEPMQRAVTGISWSPDGRRAACATYTPHVRIFATDTAMVAADLDAPRDVDVATVAYAPAGDWIVGGAVNGTIVIWNARGAIQAELTGHTQAITAVAFSPDGARLVSSSLDGAVRVWKLAALTAEPSRLIAEAAARSGLVLRGTDVVPDPSAFVSLLVPTGSTR